MSSAYFAPLVTLADVITTPGKYFTRGGDTVTIHTVSQKQDFGCEGAYYGTAERWHKSGRILASRETVNDVVRAVLP